MKTHAPTFVADLIDDDEACDNFMKRKAVAKFAGHDGDQLTDADRGNVWFCALAFVYQATSRAARQRASKHASALRLLYDQSITRIVHRYTFASKALP